VISFEANATTYKVLTKNLDINCLNGTSISVNMALGERTGRARLKSVEAENHGTATYELNVDASDDSVAMTTIDVFFSTLTGFSTDVRLIKIDVEGLKLQVVRGALKTIEKYKPPICIEVHTSQNLAELQENP
jgi:protein O-GlcNAc transferase